MEPLLLGVRRLLLHTVFVTEWLFLCARVRHSVEIDISRGASERTQASRVRTKGRPDARYYISIVLACVRRALLAVAWRN